MNYENRICCFIDILGFKQHLNQTINSAGEDNIEKIKSIQSILNLSKSITSDTGLSKSKIVTHFSDSIVISYKYDEESQLFSTLLNLLYVSMELANKGFLTRGGVAIGKLIHTDEVVFGPALVDAYNIESKLSKYPRIIVDKNVIENGLQYHSENHTKEEEKEYVMDIVTEDNDGHYYIDYVQKSSSEFDDLEYDLYRYINNLKENFFSNYDEENEDVQKKLDWLKTKINELITNIKTNIKNPEFAPDIIALYSTVEYIK
ncbi:hypothetical protein DFQ09_1176 [Winogradskyella pacifica]|uniref:Guanylate cyclase domain-containing protein n=1 Tax=Winogradskyella pacifica TaxID=664642 RepID=A0A3D9LLU9_9FLAO|nr:hypothetical protein [Winogradskyella pacifica]REE07626.1 hypothetical protein DFQ09_1176 [Winogradskyella pacifica]